MAQIHNSISRYGGLLVGIKNALGMSTGGGVERLSETLYPSMDPWGANVPEFAALRNEHLCVGQVSFGAVVGELGVAGIQGRDLSQTDIIAVVEEIVISQPAAATEWHLGYDARPVGAVNQTTLDRLDQRVRSPIANTKFVLFGDTNAVTVVNTTLHVRRVAAGIELRILGPWVLVGGAQALLVENTTPNQPITVNFRWRERQMLSTEELRQL